MCYGDVKQGCDGENKAIFELREFNFGYAL